MELTKKQLRTNITLRYMDTLANRIGVSLIPLSTTLNFFISGVISSTTLIGILLAIATLAFHLPQIIMGKKIKEDANADRTYKNYNIAKTVIYLLISLSMWFISNEIVMFITFYVLYVINQYVKGVSSIYNITLTGDMIGKQVLGKYYGYLNLFGNIGDVLGSIAIAYFIINPFSYPQNYAFIFFIVTIFSLIATILVLRMDFLVNRDRKAHQHITYREYFSQMRTIFTHDKEFLKFNISKVFAGLGTAIYAFLIIYAKDTVGITTEELFVINIVMFSGEALFSIIWGYVNTYHSWEFTYVICRSIYIVNYIILLICTTKVTIFLVYFLYGISLSGFGATQEKALIDMGGKEKSVYAAIMQMIVSPSLILSTLLISAIIDLFGYTVAIGTSFAFLILAIIIPMISVKKRKLA